MGKVLSSGLSRMIGIIEDECLITGQIIVEA